MYLHVPPLESHCDHYLVFLSRRAPFPVRTDLPPSDTTQVYPHSKENSSFNPFEFPGVFYHYSRSFLEFKIRSSK
ncbi:hypothetical protein BDN72DRAFT_838524 [Pluteus cervinus]|uniref:Uncharacterized protein n=1 Tax=Pluteus cervinus TaxID=181527 RepID=A0ACD3AYT3_9AGAR|nr:hypothetical protein BDN72DRAFT_838524 [Pluteus cervinus]